MSTGCIHRHVRPTSDHQGLVENNARHETLPEKGKAVYWWWCLGRGGGYNVSLSSKVTIKITTTSSSLGRISQSVTISPQPGPPPRRQLTKQHLSPSPVAFSCRRPTDRSYPSTAKITTSPQIICLGQQIPPCVIRHRLLLPPPLHPVRRETYDANGHLLPVTAPQEKSLVIKMMSVSS